MLFFSNAYDTDDIEYDIQKPSKDMINTVYFILRVSLL